ncbi:MAG: type II secretion system protein GspL [Thermodesulfobacteriota bacterium]
MTQRKVGFEITPSCIRMAILDGKKSPLQIITLLKREISPESDIGATLLEMLDQPPRFSDHFCTALAWHKCFVRTLNFPFKDKNKIDAAARIELESRVPADISAHIVASTPATPADSGFNCISVAVPEEHIAPILDPLDKAHIPLQLLGLSPFAEASGVLHWEKNILLVKVHADQFVLCSITDGNIGAYKNCRGIPADTDALSRRIDQEASLLWRSSNSSAQPLLLMGEHITSDLQEELQNLGHTLRQIPLTVDDNPPAAEFLPVCALAMAREDRTLNLRQGKFALKGGWSSIKKHLYAGAALLLLSVFTAGGTAFITYQDKLRQVDVYKEQMTRIFREILPDTNVVVDIPRQLQAELEQHKQRAALLGVGESASPLAALREVSRLAPEDITLDIKRFSYADDSLDISGDTTDFDSVNRLGERLRQSALFNSVRIFDAKMGIDGNKVSFRIQINISPTGGVQQ